MCLPMTDSQDYDLVVDMYGLKRIQVKTTRQKRLDKYVVGLRTLGGNRSWKGTVKFIDRDKVELLFVVTEEQVCYLIPTNKLPASTLVLGSKYDEYVVQYLP